MTIEGHWCGTKPCPECGETHACICGNDCAPPLRDQLRPIFWDVFDPDSSAQGNVQAALDAAMPIIEARIAAQRAEWEAEQGETEVEYRARATTGHVYGDVRITPKFAVAAYEEALDRETFEQDDETPVVETRRVGPWLPVEQGDAS